jgi:hypothetical protein
MMTPTQAGSAIRTSVGQCWCEFTKEDGTRRVMRFKHQIVGEIKGTGHKLTNPNKIRVWDDDANGYRTITADRLIWIDVDGKRQEIRA